MEKENIEKIMEEYKSEIQKIENDNQEQKSETNKQKLHIERLKEQREELDPIADKAVYEEYTKQIKDAEKELEDSIKETRTPEEIIEAKKEKEIKKTELKDSAIKNLTQSNINIDKKISTKELQYKVILDQISNFELKYDENHVATNGEERRELFDKSHLLIDEINELKDAKTKCEEYLNELKEPSKEVNAINSILSEKFYNNDEDIKIYDIKPKKTEVIEPEIEKSEEPKVTEIEIEKSEEPEAIEPETEKSEKPKVIEQKESENELTEIEEARRDIKEYEEELKNITDPVGAIATERLLENAKKRLEKLEAMKDVDTTKSSKEFADNWDKIDKSVDELNIISQKDSKDAIINYVTGDEITHPTDKEEKIYATYTYSQEQKELRVKEQLAKVYFDQYKGNTKGLEEKVEEEYKKYEKADINIIKLLVDTENFDRLNEYGQMLVENKINNEYDVPFEITYDIKNLSKSDMTPEAKKELEDVAYQHRHIAKIKATIPQKIKFALRALGDKIKNIGKGPKALNPGKEVTEEDVTRWNDRVQENEKTFFEDKTTESKENKFSDIKVNNNDNHIEKMANERTETYMSEFEKEVRKIIKKDKDINDD